MTEQRITIGRIVHYRLRAEDAAAINRRRVTGAQIGERMERDRRRVALSPVEWPAGAQAHVGNPASEGDAFPMIIVTVWGSEPTSAVNGQVFRRFSWYRHSLGNGLDSTDADASAFAPTARSAR